MILLDCISRTVFSGEGDEILVSPRRRQDEVRFNLFEDWICTVRQSTDIQTQLRTQSCQVELRAFGGVLHKVYSSPLRVEKGAAQLVPR